MRGARRAVTEPEKQVFSKQFGGSLSKPTVLDYTNTIYLDGVVAMKEKFVITGIVIFIAGALVAGLSMSVVAQGDQTIASTELGALPSPATWECNEIAPEYQLWLDDGNPPEQWKYVGKLYRDVADNSFYDWNVWLAWYEANCNELTEAEALAAERASLMQKIIAGTTTAAAAGAAVAPRNDSPG